MGWGAPAATLGLLRGVRAGWMGRMPDIGWGWAWPALGRCLGAIEVSVVGIGSVSLMGEEETGKRKVVRNENTWIPCLLLTSYLPGFGLTLFGHCFTGSNGLREFCRNGGILQQYNNFQFIQDNQTKHVKFLYQWAENILSHCKLRLSNWDQLIN